MIKIDILQEEIDKLKQLIINEPNLINKDQIEITLKTIEQKINNIRENTELSKTGKRFLLEIGNVLESYECGKFKITNITINSKKQRLFDIEFLDSGFKRLNLQKQSILMG